MLPAHNRLSLTERLVRPKTIRSSFFTLRTASSPTKFSRVGLIISKKVDKRAVKRNRLRRIITATLQPYLIQLQAPTDMLFVLKPLPGSATEEELRNEVLTILKKENLI